MEIVTVQNEKKQNYKISSIRIQKQIEFKFKNQQKQKTYILNHSEDNNSQVSLNNNNTNLIVNQRSQIKQDNLLMSTNIRKVVQKHSSSAKDQQIDTNSVLHIDQMVHKHQQRPLSPQQMFQRLLGQSYRQSQCENENEKIKKQRIVLIELIGQYEKSIESQLIKINQCQNLQLLKSSKLSELQRLRNQRFVIQNSVTQQLHRIQLSQEQKQQKINLTVQLQQVRCVNHKLKLKINDLIEYVKRLQIHNHTLQSEKDILQNKVTNRLRVNSQDWRHNIQHIRKRQQLQEHQYRTKLLAKQSEQIQNIRRQQEEIAKRNKSRWQTFKKTALRQPTKSHHHSTLQQDICNFTSRRLPQKVFSRFRVI